jgi:hypothetical protein
MIFFFFIQLSIQYFMTLVIATAKSKTIHKLLFFLPLVRHHDFSQFNKGLKIISCFMKQINIQ